MSKPFVLGVTGVIASGKSTVCELLKVLYGFEVIDADAIVHELYKAGGSGYEKIRERFGEQFVNESEVLRGRLRQLVFKNHQKLWILNKTMHPLIWHEVNKKIDQLKALNEDKSKRLKICLEAFYMEPGDAASFCDQVLCVDAPNDVIRERLKKRELSSKEIEKILTLQRKIHPKNFPVILYNDVGIHELTSKLHAICKQYTL